MDIIGWIGAALLLIPYFLLSTGKIKGQSKLYQGLNIGGSGALIGNSAFYGAWPSAFVNVVWIVIGVVTIILIFKRSAPDASI